MTFWFKSCNSSISKIYTFKVLTVLWKYFLVSNLGKFEYIFPHGDLVNSDIKHLFIAVPLISMDLSSSGFAWEGQGIDFKYIFMS